MQLTIIIYAIREYGIKLSHQWFKIHSKGLEIENTVSDMSMSHHTTVYYYLRELTWSTTVRFICIDSASAQSETESRRQSEHAAQGL